MGRIYGRGWITLLQIAGSKKKNGTECKIQSTDFKMAIFKTFRFQSLYLC
jgi:hypothetical protein